MEEAKYFVEAINRLLQHKEITIVECVERLGFRPVIKPSAKLLSAQLYHVFDRDFICKEFVARISMESGSLYNIDKIFIIWQMQAIYGTTVVISGFKEIIGLFLNEKNEAINSMERLNIWETVADSPFNIVPKMKRSYNRKSKFVQGKNQQSPA
jgi:hypothetical protein